MAPSLVSNNDLVSIDHYLIFPSQHLSLYKNWPTDRDSTVCHK